MLAGVLAVALAAGLAACSSAPDQPRSSGVALPTSRSAAKPVEPAAALTKEDTFTLGKPAISQRGTGSGSYNLPALRRGRIVSVAASCTGGEDVWISTVKGLLASSSTCSVRSGGRIVTEVQANQAEDKILVTVGSGEQFWLDVFESR